MLGAVLLSHRWLHNIPAGVSPHLENIAYVFEKPSPKRSRTCCSSARSRLDTRSHENATLRDTFSAQHARIARTAAPTAHARKTAGDDAGSSAMTFENVSLAKG